MDDRKREGRELSPNEVPLSTLPREVARVVIAFAFIAVVFASFR